MVDCGFAQPEMVAFYEARGSLNVTKVFVLKTD